MKNLLYIFLVLPLAGIAQISAGKQAKVDSLQQVIKMANDDSIVVKSWIAWDNMIYAIDPDLDFVLNYKIDSLCSVNLNKNLSNSARFFFHKAQGNALNVLGIVFNQRGDYSKAIDYYTKSFTSQEKIGNKKGMVNAINNAGFIYQKQGNFAKAVNHYAKGLNIAEEIGSKKGISDSYNNLGLINYEQGDYFKAIDYYTKCLAIREEIEDKRGMGSCFNNIGIIYSDQGDFEKTFDYYTKSLKIAEELGDESFMANTYNNFGAAYQRKGNNVKAIDYYTKSLAIQESIGDQNGMSSTLNNIGNIHYEQNDYVEAKNYSLRALNIAQKIGMPLKTQNASQVLSLIYQKLGNYKEGLAMYQLYINMRDSILSEANQKEVIRQEYKYQYEKQADSTAIEQLKKDELALAEEKRKEDIATKENEKNNLIIGSGAGGLGLVLLFTVFVVNRLRITRKQKDIIETQKSEVEEQKGVVEKAHEQLEEKNTEIMDSIAYAKRIQSAILPPTKLVKEYLSESFILYKPKDIVAGDFYWMEHKDNQVLFAAADCTGHGVPGAMVSVICNNGLNRSVREYGLTDPGEILDKTREVVIQEFEKSEEEVKDGMDIALCSLEGTNLKYAGANNPLWIIRNGEILETKANKQPIGKYIDPKPFTTHEVQLQKGDSIYIFSDGYVDQFGGEKGKKFKPANLRKLLLSFQDQSMENQKELLDEAFETWRGDLEQIDDVCMIGVRV